MVSFSAAEVELMEDKSVMEAGQTCQFPQRADLDLFLRFFTIKFILA